MANFTMNEWKASGEVFYLREQSGEFGASMKIRGVAKRPDLYSSNIMEMTCLLTPQAYEEGKRLGLRGLYQTVSLSGHIESWDKGKNGERDMRVYFICDKVESVKVGR